MRVKICGITRVEDGLYCCDKGVWALGFIFYPKSKRYINPDKARALVQQIRKEAQNKPKMVGVFVNEDQSLIREIKKDLGLDFVQFHGEERADEISSTRPNILALHDLDRFADDQDLNQISDHLLIDSRSGEERGGTGIVADWGFAQQLKQRHRRLILAGGIGPENIREAFSIVDPYACDLSSKVEDAPGIKNHKLIDALFRNLGEK